MGHVWTIRLKPVEHPGGGALDEMTYSEGNRSVTPEDIAEMRHRRFILLSEVPAMGHSSRSLGFNLWEHAVTEPHGQKIVPPIGAIT